MLISYIRYFITIQWHSCNMFRKVYIILHIYMCSWNSSLCVHTICTVILKPKKGWTSLPSFNSKYHYRNRRNILNMERLTLDMGFVYTCIYYICSFEFMIPGCYWRLSNFEGRLSELIFSDVVRMHQNHRVHDSNNIYPAIKIYGPDGNM